MILRGKAKAGLKTAFCVRRPFVLSGLSLLTFKATSDCSVFEDTVYEGSVVGRGLVACDLTESLCTQSPLSTVVNHHALTIDFLTTGFLQSVFLQSFFLQSTFQLTLFNHRFLMTAICTTALLTDACLIDCSRCSIVPGTFSALAYHRST